jgi:hypothetical protein
MELEWLIELFSTKISPLTGLGIFRSANLGNFYASANFNARRDRSFSCGVPMEMRIHSGS